MRRRKFIIYVFSFSLMIFIFLYTIQNTVGILQEKCPPSDFNITVLIRTMGRRRMVARQVSSIEKFYPQRFKIVIGDDGKQNETDDYTAEGIVNATRIRYAWFGFDVGVSEGRNRLLSLSDTKYVIDMDDDMVWTDGNYNVHRAQPPTPNVQWTLSVLTF